MYITLLADDTGGGWAFGPRTESTPAQVQPAHIPHITLPMCEPAASDPLTVARATITLDAAATAAFTTTTQPPHSELRHPAVLLVTVPEHRLAVAVGVFADTYTAHHWWATTRTRLNLPGMSTGVYPVINALALAARQHVADPATP